MSWKSKIKEIVESKHLLYKEDAIYAIVEDLFDEYWGKIAAHNRTIKLGSQDSHENAYVKGVNHQRALTLARLEKLRKRFKK